MEVATLIISSITMIVACLGPLVPAMAHLLTHIKQSDCCGGKLTTHNNSEHDLLKKRIKKKILENKKIDDGYDADIDEA